MSTVKEIEVAVRKLTEKELSSFRAWFAEYDWQVWDRRLEKDVAAGKLDRFAAEALAVHRLT